MRARFDPFPASKDVNHILLHRGRTTMGDENFGAPAIAHLNFRSQWPSAQDSIALVGSYNNTIGACLTKEGISNEIPQATLHTGFEIQFL
jgi:hypothetical protein